MQFENYANIWDVFDLWEDSKSVTLYLSQQDSVIDDIRSDSILQLFFVQPSGETITHFPDTIAMGL